MKIVRRGIQYFREEGYGKGIRRLYRETLGKWFLVMNIFIFRVPVTNGKYDYESKLDVSIKQIVKETSSQLVGVSYSSPENILKWLEEGKRCFAAEHHGKIISFVWAGYKNIYVPDLGMNLNLADDEFYMFNGFTPSRYRRLGLQKEIIAEMLAFHREMGYRKMMVITSAQNREAIGVVRNCFLGEKHMVITHVKLFWKTKNIKRVL